MSNVLVLYYSSYGHIETMAKAVAEVVREAGAHVAIKRATQIVMMHLGMVIVGLPYTFKGKMRMDEVTGCSPYGASTLAEDDKQGNRQPSTNELDGARFQGRHVAEIATALARGWKHRVQAATR